MGTPIPKVYLDNNISSALAKNDTDFSGLTVRPRP
jgi:hypothetical protein